ncbi:MAG TPA: long-chain fatty acid--CoA ligase [Acidimicrobiales bacterium]|nr:long-chain fatty acid--CoA ligase [Acidimicrobiales bacterium]
MSITVSPSPSPLASEPSARTIVDHFRLNVARHALRPALRWRTESGWEHLTWQRYGERVWNLSAGLIALGIEPGDRVAILSTNRPEWHLADMATIAAGAVTVPLYATSTSSQVAYMLAHSSTRVCVVESPDQLAKVLLRRDELPMLEHVVLVEPAEGLDGDLVVSFADLESSGARRRAIGGNEVDERVDALRADDLLTLVYTSGTTGRPKGAMLTHGNVIATVESITSVVPIGPDDRFLSFLPLSHIAERTVSHFGQLIAGGETWFARGLATVAEDLTDCRPTIFFAVPRVWEKLHEALVERMAGQPEPMRRLFDRYVRLGLAVVAHRQDGAPLRFSDHARHAALGRSLGHLVRHRLGLDKARVLVSGAAPIHPDLLRWFHAIGLPIAEVYGQTEDCGPTTLNPPGAIRVGTVGPPVPGVEVRIATDGEILVKGPNVCVGYFDDPDATAELIDAEGWMHSGDLGALDDGYLRITGRKKDLIVNSAGKNIAPQPIETDLRQEPFISQAVVVGDGRSYLVALVTIDPVEVAAWATAHGRLLDAEALTTDTDVLAAIEAAVERVNRHHAPVEQIKRWRVLPNDFTVARDELTPTLKVKRSVVMDHYADLIDQLYEISEHPDR